MHVCFQSLAHLITRQLPLICIIRRANAPLPSKAILGILVLVETAAVRIYFFRPHTVHLLHATIRTGALVW